MSSSSARPTFLARSKDTYECVFLAGVIHFNVRLPRTIIDDEELPATFDMTVGEYPNLPTPTHILAATVADPQGSSGPPFMLPIDATRWEEGFRADLGISSTSTAPEPHESESGRMVVTLPVVPLVVPHLLSLPVLLVLGMGLESDTAPLTWRLLPPEVIEEFPNAATMSLILSKSRNDRFDRVMTFNQGIWRNVLALGLKNTMLVQTVQTAWNITVEARKIRQRAGTQPPSPT